jgi:hypothetical protein
LDIFRIRFWPFMADTFLDIALYGHAFICGDVLYGSVYLATGEHVRPEAIKPAQLDQSIRDLFRYPAHARRIHHFRMELEMYFGAPPLFFVRANGNGLELGHDPIRKMVQRYQKRWRNEPMPQRSGDALARKEVSKAELEAMVCHDGRWYANQHEVDEAVENMQYEAELQPWAVPEWMLRPKPKARVRRRKKRWIV